MKIKVKEDKISYTVSGLSKRYTNEEDIDKETVMAVLDYAEDDVLQQLGDYETLIGLKRLMFVSENEITNGNSFDEFDDELIAIFEVKYTYSEEFPEMRYYVTTVNPFYPSLPFTSSVDKLVNEYRVYIYSHYFYGHNLDETVKEIKTDHLRDTVIELDVTKYADLI